MATLEIKLAGHNNYSTIVDEEDYRTLNLDSYKWRPIIRRCTTYVTSYYKNGREIRLHRLIMGLMDAPRSVIVDHIDGNGLNNSRTNLRITDKNGNAQNRRKLLSKKCSSSYKGVCWKWSHNKTNPWYASIRLPDGGKSKHLGYYRTEIEAALSYNKAASELFGPMAFLNVIDPDNKK